MIDVLIQGRLAADPERREAKNGKGYATARLSVTDREGGEHLVLATAFDEQAVAALLALERGDAVAVAGELSVQVWTPEGREPRPSLRVLVHRVLSAYAVQRTRRAAAGGGGARRERSTNGMEAMGKLWGRKPDSAGRMHDGAGW
jgi:single-stranded DNA-binding protein